MMLCSIKVFFSLAQDIGGVISSMCMYSVHAVAQCLRSEDVRQACAFVVKIIKICQSITDKF